MALVYIGTVDLYTDDDYGSDGPSNPNVEENRITTYRLYIPKDYVPPCHIK